MREGIWPERTATVVGMDEDGRLIIGLVASLTNVGYTTDQAPDAIPNGTTVEKVNSEPDDAHTDGSRATVVGSMGPLDDEQLPDPYFYFVEWEDRPGIPVGISGHRIRAS